MKKLLISGLTIATLMGSFATSASAGWVASTVYGTTYINGTGSHSGQNYVCSTVYGTTTCN